VLLFSRSYKIEIANKDCFTSFAMTLAHEHLGRGVG